MDVENTQAPQDDSDLWSQIKSPVYPGLLDQADTESQQEASCPIFTQQHPAVDGSPTEERDVRATATAAPSDEMTFDGEKSNMG